MGLSERSALSSGGQEHRDVRYRCVGVVYDHHLLRPMRDLLLLDEYERRVVALCLVRGGGARFVLVEPTQPG
jgi:hypothetical protein